MVAVVCNKPIYSNAACVSLCKNLLYMLLLSDYTESILVTILKDVVIAKSIFCWCRGIQYVREDERTLKKVIKGIDYIIAISSLPPQYGVDALGKFPILIVRARIILFVQEIAK